MPDKTKTVDITVRPQQRGIDSAVDHACTYCGKRRHEVGMLTTTLYADSLEVTIRTCGHCLVEAGVRDILPGDEM